MVEAVVAVAVVAVAVKKSLLGGWITFITHHYFFTQYFAANPNLNESAPEKKIETHARKAIMKFSKHDLHSATNYLSLEQNEVAAWINLAIWHKCYLISLTC